jgi:hypothetical protein
MPSEDGLKGPKHVKEFIYKSYKYIYESHWTVLSNNVCKIRGNPVVTQLLKIWNRKLHYRDAGTKRFYRFPRTTLPTVQIVGAVRPSGSPVLIETQIEIFTRVLLRLCSISITAHCLFRAHFHSPPPVFTAILYQNASFLNCTSRGRKLFQHFFWRDGQNSRKP